MLHEKDDDKKNRKDKPAAINMRLKPAASLSMVKCLYKIFYKIRCSSISDFKCNSIGFYYSSYCIIFKRTAIIFVFTYSMCNS